MNNIMKKFEDILENKISEFEKSPVKTAIKLLIILWLFKIGYNWFFKDKDDERY